MFWKQEIGSGKKLKLEDSIFANITFSIGEEAEA